MIAPFLVYHVGGHIFRLPKIPAEREEAAAFRVWNVIHNFNFSSPNSTNLAELESKSKMEAYTKFQRCEFSLEDK